MNRAYSLIKGDYIFAANCFEYNTSYSQQLRCPICMEPVYLRGGEKNIKHFAHYKETANSSYCEIREKSFSEYSFRQEEYQTKGQNLFKHYTIEAILFAEFLNVNQDFEYNILSSFERTYFSSISQLINKEKSELCNILNKDFMQNFKHRTLIYFLRKCEFLKLPEKTNVDYFEEYKSSLIYFHKLIEDKKTNFLYEGKKYIEKNTFYINFEKIAINDSFGYSKFLNIDIKEYKDTDPFIEEKSKFLNQAVPSYHKNIKNNILSYKTSRINAITSFLYLCQRLDITRRTTNEYLDEFINSMNEYSKAVQHKIVFMDAAGKNYIKYNNFYKDNFPLKTKQIKTHGVIELNKKQHDISERRQQVIKYWNYLGKKTPLREILTIYNNYIHGKKNSENSKPVKDLKTFLKNEKQTKKEPSIKRKIIVKKK